MGQSTAVGESVNRELNNENCYSRAANSRRSLFCVGFYAGYVGILLSGSLRILLLMIDARWSVFGSVRPKKKGVHARLECKYE